MSEDEHHRYIFEKMNGAIDKEVAVFTDEQPDLDHDRIKRNLRKVVGPYLRSKRNASMTSDEEFRTGLVRFMKEAYPGNEPNDEYQAIYMLFGRVQKRLGWDQIADP